jgi:hypothetical protein
MPHAGEPGATWPIAASLTSRRWRFRRRSTSSSAANVVIELGSWCGASALWLRDRLRSNETYGRIERPLVITIDVDLAAARPRVEAVDPHHEGIVMLRRASPIQSCPIASPR